MKLDFILKYTLILSFLCGSYFNSHAQDCTANAGGNVIICGSSKTLVGGVSGTVGAGTPTCTFYSGPGSTTPLWVKVPIPYLLIEVIYLEGRINRKIINVKNKQ